jgi:UDP-glucose 4-epimerase
MKKILITGGCGYVGRELVNSLYETHDIYIVDNLSSGVDRLDKLNIKKNKIYNIDICDEIAVSKLLKSLKPDVIVHLAALHFIPDCEKNPKDAAHTNINGTINLLANAPEYSKFIFTSSAAVYAPSNKPLTENSTIGPMDIYGWTKLHGEHYATYYSKIRDLDLIIVRLFNVIGPGETNPHILPEIISQIKSNKNSLSLGDTRSKRDYIDVRDVASAYKIFISKNLSEEKIINLGTGVTYSVDEMLHELELISLKKLKVVKDPTKIRSSDRPILHANIDKLIKLYNFRPSHKFEQSIRLTYETDEL